jgi:voltage-gated potassium channel
LPREDVDPVRAILRRAALGIGLLLLMAVLVWLDRDGYKDVDDEVTFLDAVYYATVSASTTGFGDIAPVSDAARTVNVLVVTPLRVAFLIVLVGSTLEVATRASRQRLRVARWQAAISDHTVVIGFGTTGRAAATRLTSGGIGTSQVVVVADDAGTVADATACGFVVVDGDATRRDILLAAEVGRARSIVVALPDDATAVLATLTARQLNRTATIVAAVRELENADVLRDGGADAVILTAAAAGRQLAHGLRSPTVGALYEQLLAPGDGPDLIERDVKAVEVGVRVADVEELVVAVVRDEHVHTTPDPSLLLLEGDRLVLFVQQS